jgi:hypothetical protein
MVQDEYMPLAPYQVLKNLEKKGWLRKPACEISSGIGLFHDVIGAGDTKTQLTRLMHKRSWSRLTPTDASKVMGAGSSRPQAPAGPR